MKKIIAILLAILLIVSVLCLSGCFGILDFFDDLWNDDYDIDDDSDHAHKYDSYFTYSECSVEGCSKIGRKKSRNIYANEFVYTLTDAESDEIAALYDEMLTYLADGKHYSKFENLYGKYLDWVDYVGHQYQVSSILSDVEYNTTTASNFRKASALYNDMFAKYYEMFGLIYNSNYRKQFYSGWSADEIEEALYYAEIYGGNADNNNAVDDILAEYEDYMDSIGGTFSSNTATLLEQMNTVGEMYGRLIEANNNVAKAAHYGNYMDYAYAHEYNRDYTPDDVATMRAFVKEYVAPIFINLAYKDKEYYNVEFNSNADKDFYNAMMSDSLFTKPTDRSFGRVNDAINLINDYFEFVYKPRSFTGGSSFSFQSAVEDLFKNGNYFTGEYGGAYTWWISKINKPILYFGPKYDTPFTFVHEFGHYYNNIYNGSLHLSYDQDETHSQGDEMLFLAWLSQNLPSGVTNGFDVVEVEQLYDMLINIVIATAVDEFEQAAYTGYYNGKPIDCSYADLFVKILGSYKGTYNGQSHSALSFLNSTYWAYVVFRSAGYYISYAMSALPSIELYVQAQSNGLDAALDSYVKLFTFSNDSRFVSKDFFGRKTLTSNATYSAILNYSGLKDPFDKAMYTNLKAYFDSRTDLK